MKTVMKHYGFVNPRKQHEPKLLYRKHFQASGFPISNGKLFFPLPVTEVPNTLGSKQPSENLSYGLSPWKNEKKHISSNILHISARGSKTTQHPPKKPSRSLSSLGPRPPNTIVI